MSTTTDTPTGIGLREAAAQFEDIFAASDADTGDTNEAPVSEEAEVEQTEALAATDTQEETPDVVSDEGDELSLEENAEEPSEEEAAADTREDVIEATPEMLDKLVTVKIDGKDEQVTLKEALNGYQRTADYTRKTMALAENAKAFEAEKEAITTERQQYAQLLPVLVEQIKASMEQEPDWQRLIDSDPVEYVRQERLWREKQDRLAAAQEEQRRLADIQAQEQYQAVVSAVQSNKAALLEKMPEWRNPDKWDADRRKLLAYGEKLGFNQNEIQQTYDHRAVLALYKAMKYDELMAKRPVPKQPDTPRPVRPGSAARQNSRQTSDLTRAKQRLAKTGRVRDAANLFEQMMQ